MNEIISLKDYKKKSAEKKATDKNKEYIAAAQKREAGWEVFSSAVQHLKNKQLTAKQAVGLMKTLIANFNIESTEIVIDDLIKFEFEHYAPDSGQLKYGNKNITNIAMSVISAAQQKIINKNQAIRIIKVIKVWYNINQAK